MENILILDRVFRRDRPSGRSFDKGKYPAFWTDGSSASFCSAGMAVSGGLDRSLRSDGVRCGTDQPDAGQQGQKQSVEYLCSTTHCEFLLEPDFLQCRGIWVCVPMADSALAADPLDDSCILEGG